MQPVLEVQNLTVRYGDIVAVDNLDLAIPPDCCFGLLGPNGAGKTTTIEVMEGIRAATSGSVLYRGKPLGSHYSDRVGIQFQETALQEFITVEETIRMFASLYSRTRPFDELVELCDLSELLARDNRKLSGGQRQRMLLALALVNDPDVMFLDEPTTGLDPQARRGLWELVRRVRGEGRTVILTTHYMDEAEVLCDEIAIMDHGTVISRAAPDRLISDHFKAEAIVRLPRSGAGVDESTLPEGARLYDDSVDIPTTAVDQTIQDLISRGVSLDGLSIHRPNLDDLFLDLTGTRLRA